MSSAGFLALEARRLAFSIFAGVVAWFVADSPQVGAIAFLIALVVVWGWQLFRVYRWFAHPEELPPISGAGLRSILRDVYVLRSRGVRGELSSKAQPYVRESLASVREPALIINSRSELTWCNDAAEYLLGITLSEEEGKALSKILPGKALKRYLEENNFQKPLRLKPGPDPEWCIQLEFSLFGASDRLIFVKDVTDQDRLERMRRDFVGNVSHELRTPLTVIKGYIETLLEFPASENAMLQKSLASMGVQANRMESLISDLLWLSSIESEEGERKADRIDVRALLAEIKSELATVWPDREVQLKLKSSFCVLGDERELRSAISNLIVNALKYSEKHPVLVSWVDSPVGPSLRVEDKGLGIEAKHIPRLTERFYRVDKSRSQATGGTGLGLAIVKHVAVSHDAKLFVESQPGKGSCFKLVFPEARAVTAEI